MKFTCDRDLLISALTPVGSVASGHNTIAALDGILMNTQPDGTVSLVGFDLEKGINTSIPCRIDEEGFFFITAQRFIQIVRLMPSGELTVEIDKSSCKTKIYSGGSMFEIMAHPGSEYPDLPQVRQENGFTMKQSDLLDILRRTTFAAAINDPRPFFNGVFFHISGETITTVGCDGSRLALVEQKSELIAHTADNNLEMKFIIPAKTLDELTKLLGSDENVTIWLARKHILFDLGKFKLFTRHIDVDYIDYQRFLPQSSAIIVNCDAQSFENALERALVVTEEKNKGQAKSPVILNFTDGLLTVSSVSVTNRVSDDIPVSKTGGDLEIAFNCRHLCDAIRVCDPGELRLSLNTPLTSMLIEPVEQEENRKFLLLVLPVRK